jgi:hypothetical protein
LNPLLPLAAIVAVYAIVLSAVALHKRRIRAALMWLLLLGLSAWVMVATFPVIPDRNEGMAMGDCRAVLSAQEAYRRSNGGSFGDLKCLASPASCGFAADTPAFLDAAIAAVTLKHGYNRRFVAGPRGSGKPDPGISSFVYVVTPVRARGNRAFAVDSTGRYCFTTDGTSPPIRDGLLAPTCNVLP